MMMYCSIELLEIAMTRKVLDLFQTIIIKLYLFPSYYSLSPNPLFADYSPIIADVEEVMLSEIRNSLLETKLRQKNNVQGRFRLGYTGTVQHAYMTQMLKHS